jgi:hypothetical protein
MADSDGIHVMIISQDTGGKLFDQILSEASFAEICKAMEFPFNPQQCLNPKKISIPAPE